MAKRSKNEDAEKHHLFEDISLVQVMATALAAVTSMLLSSYIGIAGSVIGVAIASVVSTMTASLYKHFLKESAEKLKEIPAVEKTHSFIEQAISKDPTKSDSADETIDVAEEATDTDHTTEDVHLPQKNKLELDAKKIEHELDDKKKDLTEEAEKALQSKKHMKIGLIAVCVISALITVALSATIIYITSQGQGIGTKPQEIFTPTSEIISSSDKDGKGSLDHSDASDSSASSSNADSSSTASSDSSASSSADNSSSSSSSSASSSSAGSSAGSSDSTSDDSSSSTASGSSPNDTAR